MATGCNASFLFFVFCNLAHSRMPGTGRIDGRNGGKKEGKKEKEGRKRKKEGIKVLKLKSPVN